MPYELNICLYVGRMDLTVSDSECKVAADSTIKPKKRPKVGKIMDANKSIRAKSRVEGENCQCQCFKCFLNVT